MKIVLIDLQQDMQHLLRNMLKDIRVRQQLHEVLYLSFGMLVLTG